MKLLLVLGLALSSSLTQAEQIVLGDRQTTKAVSNVAIIGAGAAGSSSAFHLAQYAEAAGLPINITIFDKNPFIGGRSTTVNAYNDPSMPIELGASIFVKINHILVDAVKAFNLSTGDFMPTETDIPGPALAVWDGSSFVFTQQREGGWWDTAKLFYRYGLAPVRTMNLMKSTVAKFLKMYDEPVFPFASLSQAAQDVGLTAATASTGEQYLRENNIGNLFAREIVQASTRVNYAQNLPHIHGLEAMVCMASNGAMSVEDGNWQIFSNMVEASGAKVMLGTQVLGITKQRNDQYSLSYRSDEANTQSTDTFDEVILAAPHQFTNISLDIPSAQKPDSIPYVQLHVTLFTSPHLLNPAFFNLPSSRSAPHSIITTLPQTEHPPSGPAGVGSPGFFSISLLRALTNPTTGGQEYAYKIFSPSAPNSTFLSHLLGVDIDGSSGEVSHKDITWLHRKVWNSYPYELPRMTFESIRLDSSSEESGRGGLWYTSGIESFISTMETSALMGKNVARLIVDGWLSSSLDSDAKTGSRLGT